MKSELISNDIISDQGFEVLFKTHFKALHAYASVMLYHDTHAEEIVQNVFLRLWENRDEFQIESSIKAYLYKCVHNDCLNFIKHKKVRTKYANETAYVYEQSANNTAERLKVNQLTAELSRALNLLPEQCRTIFQMSRFEELKYREIADQLGISVKTVENQMGKALRILRTELADFLPLLVFFLHGL